MSVSAVTNKDGSWIFVVGTYNGVWHKWQTSPGGDWSNWDEV